MGNANDCVVKKPLAVSDTTGVALVWAAVCRHRQGARRKGERALRTCHRDSTIGAPFSCLAAGMGSCRGHGSTVWKFFRWLVVIVQVVVWLLLEVVRGKARGPAGWHGVLMEGRWSCWVARGPARWQ